MGQRQTAIAYVDGFNLYYGLRDSCDGAGIRWRWIDIPRLCRMIVPEVEVTHLKYFTARVQPQGHAKAKRQARFLRALRSLPNVSIHYGSFIQKEAEMRLASNRSRRVRVLRTEEKGSDVNLATHLVVDGLVKHAFGVAVVVSNDSDLVYPIQVVRAGGCEVGVLNPHLDQPSAELRKVASWVRPIRPRAVRMVPLAPELRDADGVFRKPPAW
jgi:uncharacterized LabA/DUF88 family protein